jgi:hypothetical protein
MSSSMMADENWVEHSLDLARRWKAVVQEIEINHGNAKVVMN